jgi:hypothetical protein
MEHPPPAASAIIHPHLRGPETIIDWRDNQHIDWGENVPSS